MVSGPGHGRHRLQLSMPARSLEHRSDSGSICSLSTRQVGMLVSHTFPQWGSGWLSAVADASCLPRLRASLILPSSGNEEGQAVPH